MLILMLTSAVHRLTRRRRIARRRAETRSEWMVNHDMNKPDLRRHE